MAPDRTVEIPADLLASASEAARRRGANVSDQIVRWVRMGRDVESGADLAAVEAVLEGMSGYDDLSPGEQAMVRAVWAERIIETRDALDYEAKFIAAGDSWTEADQEGQVIRRP